MRRDFFALHRLTRFRHDFIVLAKLICEHRRKKVVIVAADHRLARDIKQLFKLPVDEQIAVGEIFNVDHC